MNKFLPLGIVALALQSQSLVAAPSEPLEHVRTISMPGVTGRIDHLGLDTHGRRLFVAALGNDTVEVIDLRSGSRVQSLRGFGKPQAILHLADPDRVYVTSGSANRIDILDGTSYAVLKRIEGIEDADNLRHDPKAGRAYVSHGGGLAILDVRSGTKAGNIALSGQPESFQLEQNGGRIFANVPSARHVAVVDRSKGSVVSTWKLDGAAANYPMALDEAGQRLFVGTRKPAKLLVYDTGTGRLVTALEIGGDTDDVFYDAARKRIYAICGEGVISVIQQTDAEHYAPLRTIRTASGARTGLFAPGTSELYVAAPARGSSIAEIRVYSAH
jgi:DNA-binding beta-propeller fold protein YncE